MGKQPAAATFASEHSWNWKNKLVEGSYREKLGLVKFPLYPSIRWTTALI